LVYVADIASAIAAVIQSWTAVAEAGRRKAGEVTAE
jgi:hypothetical protein